MKKLAGHNFEDILQVGSTSISVQCLISFLCVIPCIEDILEEDDNQIVLDLMFDLATFHALAKMRVHVDYTVTLLDHMTTSLGNNM